MSECRSLTWVLAHTRSWLSGVVQSRVNHGDAPRDPVTVFWVERDLFSLIEWDDGRWLVMALCCPGAAHG